MTKLKQVTNKELREFLVQESEGWREKLSDFPDIRMGPEGVKLVSDVYEDLASRLPVWNTNMVEAPKDGTVILIDSTWAWDGMYEESEPYIASAKWDSEAIRDGFYQTTENPYGDKAMNPTRWMHIPSEEK